jgi:hypothetical protein
MALENFSEFSSCPGGAGNPIGIDVEPVAAPTQKIKNRLKKQPMLLERLWNDPTTPDNIGPVP